MINLAHTMEMTTVAEGVETIAQLDVLRCMGCPVVQGYLLSRPVSVADLAKLLEREPAVFAKFAA